eukprot:TRINITY_DN6372_c0_g1_i2.p1 TRINITY_DN6372_c0_g1~~TRINITY_DN6372_c0_g1_i2.p1  ORF type:complete len:197 (-),score=67.36 TRINITY_DN6372_c0_g1_i2:159-749(-)
MASNWRWHQSENSLSISFSVPAATRPGDLDVTFDETSVRAGLKGAQAHLEGRLFGVIKPALCKSTVKLGLATLQLEKQRPGRWPEVFDKAAAAAAVGKRVKAVYDYEAQDAGELGFDEGDVITVLAEQPSGWWRGELNGRTGMFPSNFVEQLRPDPAAKLRPSPPEQPEPTEEALDRSGGFAVAAGEGVPSVQVCV